VLETSRYVDLASTRLRPANVPAVLDLFARAKALEAVLLFGNDFDEPSALAIVAAAAERKLSVCGYYRGMADRHDDFYTLAAAASAEDEPDFDRTVAQWDGSEDHITDIDAVFIAADMALLGFQQGLIDACNVGDVGARHLAKMLESNTTLTTLFLRDNQIGVEGLKAFAASLPKNQTLAVLDLTEGNPWEAAVEAGDEEAIAAAKVIEEHRFAEFAPDDA